MNVIQSFFALHKQAKPLILPNAWDAASARIFEDLGATAIATTSSGVAWSLGYPDGGKLPAKMQAQVAQNILRVITVPLSIDFENGYSDDPKQVAENIKPLLDTGVSGINIEDGTDSPELLASKIEAIKSVVANHGSELFINVRTDVYLASLVSPENRVNEVIVREKRYAAAGGDGLFVPLLADEKDITEIVNSILLPLNVMSVPTLPKAAKLAELGVKRLSAGAGIPQIAWQAAETVAAQFLLDGDSAALTGKSMDRARLQRLMDI